MGIEQKLIFLPVLVQMLLTVAMFFALAVAKSQAIKAGTVDRARSPLHENAWPVSVQKINNNIRNQFQLPVLFYVLAVILYLLNAVGLLTLWFAWGFVVSRIVHALIHTGPNPVPVRFLAWLVGFVCLLFLLGAAIGALLAHTVLVA